jgi:cell division septation protein DedD
MATNPDRDEFLEDEEQDELARRSIFSAGWFRALLVLTVLAIVVVVSLPYLLNWLEPTPPSPPAKTQAKSSATSQTPTPAPPPVTAPPPSTMVPPAPAPAPAPAPPTPPAPAPSTSAPSMPTPSAPTPTAKVETPAPPPAKGETPKAPRAPAEPSPAERPVGTAPLPVAPAPSSPAAKGAPAAKQAPAAKLGAPVEGGSPGNYFVQVGAFLEEKNAESLAKQLRGESFPVQITQVTRGGSAAPAAPAKSSSSGGQNQLFITGSTPDAVNAALKGKGTAQAVKGGIVVNPAFDLETAMSLSSSLKKDGFKVVIRRAKAGQPAPKTTGGQTFHIVRVGGYPDRAKAQQARGELEAKGHPGFLSQGAAR